MRLTMKSIIRWEQFNKKPFSELCYTNEQDLFSLLYVSSDLKVPFEEFKQELKEEDIINMIKEFEQYTSIMSQFQTKLDHKDSDNSSLVYISDLISTLVMQGLDAYFALSDLELCDLPVFLKAYDQKVKDQLTLDRLWTYIQVSPHLEKGVTPQDLYPFVWEKKDISTEQLEESKQEFNLFLESGLK